MNFISDSLTRISQSHVVEVVKNILNTPLKQAVAAVALAAIVLLGITLLCKCCCCCFRARHIEEDDDIDGSDSDSEDLHLPESTASTDLTPSASSASSDSAQESSTTLRPTPPPKPAHFGSMSLDALPPSTPQSTPVKPKLKDIRETVASQSCTIDGSPLTGQQKVTQSQLLGDLTLRLRPRSPDNS